MFTIVQMVEQRSQFFLLDGIVLAKRELFQLLLIDVPHPLPVHHSVRIIWIYFFADQNFCKFKQGHLRKASFALALICFCTYLIYFQQVVPLLFTYYPLALFICDIGNTSGNALR